MTFTIPVPLFWFCAGIVASFAGLMFLALVANIRKQRNLKTP